MSKGKKDYMTLTKAEAVTGISARTLRYAAKKGHLKAQQIDDFIWITTLESIYEWLASNKHRKSGKL